MIAKILDLIEERGLSQAAVERLCGLSAARITKWKDGVGEPKASDILKIADLLEVPVRFLVDDKMDRPLPELNEQQRWILQAAESLGYEVARQRLLAVHQTEKPPITPVGERQGAESRPLNITVRKDLRGPVVPEIKPKGQAVPKPKGEPENSGHKR